MSIEDLREQGVLLPEEEWGEHRLETTVPLVPVAVGYVTAVLSLVAMYVGGGGTLTWIGAGTFLVALYTLTWMCDRAVLRQRTRVRRESGGASDAETGPGDDGRSSGEGAGEP
jgi:hypothetical protein